MRSLAYKKLLFISLLVVMVIAIICLSVRFSGPALHWQLALQQAQAGLLFWRIGLYAMFTGCGWGLHRYLWGRYTGQLPRLTRLMCWSLAVIILNEVSNFLQWRHFS